MLRSLCLSSRLSSTSPTFTIRFLTSPPKRYQIIMTCSNCQGDHFRDDCPLPLFCTGCHSDEHCWSECRAVCGACGTPRHTKEYCLDFKPGQAQRPHDSPKRPKHWPHTKSYKTTIDEIQAGRSARSGPLIISSQRSPSSPPLSKSQLRPTAPIFYPRQAEDMPSGPAPVPAFDPHLHSAAPKFYHRRGKKTPSVQAPVPVFPPHLRPAAVVAAPTTQPVSPPSIFQQPSLQHQRPSTRTYDESQQKDQHQGTYDESQHQDQSMYDDNQHQAMYSTPDTVPSRPNSLASLYDTIMMSGGFRSKREALAAYYEAFQNASVGPSEG